MINKIKYAYQRITRGFSDKDCFNGDVFIAGQIAGIMQWMIDNGHGVSTFYADDLDTPIEIMVERRNADFTKIIEIFREYSENGPAINEDWKSEFGGVLDKDMAIALQWLSEHFQELWD